LAYYSKILIKQKNDSLFKNKIKRKRKKERIKRGRNQYQVNLRKKFPKYKKRKSSFRFNTKKIIQTEQSLLPNSLKYIIEKTNAFAYKEIKNENNIFRIPTIFSFNDAYEETSIFIRKLINALYEQTYKSLIIDYGNCHRIDVDASICMDIILSEFIKYYERLNKNNYGVYVDEIKPINYKRYEIEKILFSIGAFKVLKNVEIKYDNIIPYKLCKGDKTWKDIANKREVHITEMVDYIIACLEKMGKTLSADSEDNLYKVIGEVMINAEEHSNTNYRYSIGYFEKISSKDNNGSIGTFNLAILNFGNSIYETFKDPNCKNTKVINQMKLLSEKYTKKNWFKKSQFEEETLWTLYALQEGVTRKEDWKRGNGSIRFIESFFKLKGNVDCDNLSMLKITSGHTNITFDGKYKIVERQRGRETKPYKMMTFNENGNIEEMPDENYVTFTHNYFPGTLITARICIDSENIEN
jgi:hypothetical protein